MSASSSNGFLIQFFELFLLLSFKVWVVEPIRAGEEITISYIRTFCSRKFRQSLLLDRFGFSCGCPACCLSGEALVQDDRGRMEIDRLAQRFAQVKRNNKIRKSLLHVLCVLYVGLKS